MPQWLSIGGMIVGGLGLFAGAVDGAKYGFGGTRWLFRKLRAGGAFLVSPWTLAPRLERRVRRLEENGSAQAKEEEPTAHFRGVRWKRIPHEGSNGAFCDICFEREGRLYRLEENAIESTMRLYCPNKEVHEGHHFVRMPLDKYEFGRRMRI